VVHDTDPTIPPSIVATSTRWPEAAVHMLSSGFARSACASGATGDLLAEVGAGGDENRRERCLRTRCIAGRSAGAKKSGGGAIGVGRTTSAGLNGAETVPALTVPTPPTQPCLPERGTASR
jgi:hypothetical protein